MNRSLLERYFKGNVTDRERCKVAEWVAKSLDNLKEYMAARRLYDSVLLSDEFNDAQLSIPKLNSRRNRSWFAIAVSVAASIAVLVTLFVKDQWRGTDNFQIYTVSSPIGQQTHTMLSDGTLVWLNSGSVIEVVSLAGDQRRVRLTGEAYLNVAKDPTKPFIVETDNVNITVLGTEFNVNSYGTTQSVMLVNGKVNVTDKKEGGSYELFPGELFEIDVLTGEKSIKNVDAENFISWTNGYLKFESLPMKQVLTQLQSFYGIKMVIGGGVNDSLLISGKLELRKGMDKALESLCLISSLDYIWLTEDSISITAK